MRALALGLLCFSAAAGAMSPAPAAEAVAMECPWIGLDPAVRSAADAAGWRRLGATTEAAFARATDWSRERLVQLDLGSRPTPGYRLELAEARYERAARRWVFTVREQRPPADALLAQVIRHPCLVVRVPAGYREAWLQDVSGQTRAQARALE